MHSRKLRRIASKLICRTSGAGLKSLFPDSRSVFKNPCPTGMPHFYFHHEIIPPDTNDNLYNTADMRKQFDALIRHQFPDAVSVESSSPGVTGKIIINMAYELTNSGKPLKRRYTYFIADRTAFVVQSSAAPDDWESALPELDKMIASLVPGNAPVADTISDDTAVASLRQHTSLPSCCPGRAIGMPKWALSRYRPGPIHRCTTWRSLWFLYAGISDPYMKTPN